MNHQQTSQQQLYKDEALTVEPHGIEHISEGQRHGRPSNQFTIRFSPVIYLAAIFLGAAGIPLGLGLTGSITAVLLGNVLGAICTATCATMGPKLGMPQLPMGRSAFGYRGNYLPAALALLLYVGYFTVGTVLGAKSLSDLSGLPYVPLAIVVAGVSVLIAIFGYNLLHVFGTWVTRVSIVLLIAVSITLVVHGVGSGASGHLHGSKYWLVWLLEFTIVFSYTMSWSPYASDYSRYLPTATSGRKVFGWAFLGLFLATTWMMVLGAALGTLSAKGDVLAAFGVALPTVFLKIVLTVLGVSAIPHNAVNLYSGAMSSLTWDLPLKRWKTVLACGVIGCVLAVVFGGQNFQDHFNAFLFLVSYYVMPWLAIICIDFYWKRRRGGPRISDYYRKDGPLGGIRWSGLVAFVVGIAVSVPFMATDMYTGPIGHALDGADLSYFVSFIVAGVIYAAASRSTVATAEPAVSTPRT